MTALLKRSEDASYEALLDELDDLRIETIARERIKDFDKFKTISHDEIFKKRNKSS